MLVHQFLENSASRVPDKTALIFKDIHWSYRQLNVMADRLAAHLIHSGVKKGDRVLIFLNNSMESVVALFAILKAGAAFVIPNATMKSRKLKFILNDSGAHTLITHPCKIKVLRDALPQARTLQTVIWCGDGESCELEGVGPVGTGLAHESWSAIMAENRKTGAVVHAPSIIDVDIATIIYTSGSTADPKGVVSTHRNVNAASKSIIQYLQNKESDTIICALPLSFDYGLYQIVMTFLFGGTVVLESSFSYPYKILEKIEKYQVTGVPVVPTMLNIIWEFNDLPSFPFASVRYISNTGAVLTPAMIRKIRTTWPHISIYSMYGLTECKRVSFLPPDLIDIHPESVGIAIPNSEAFIVDPKGNKVSANQEGELVVRGSNVMAGYWNDPESTNRTFRKEPRSGDVWLYTGDLFRQDEGGLLYFVARKDDLIKTKGERVSPKEIEMVLCSIDGIIEAAVIGIPDPTIGQAIKAYVVKNDSGMNEKKIKKICMQELEPFMMPKEIQFLERIPKLANGKVDKNELRAIDMIKRQAGTHIDDLYR